MKTLKNILNQAVPESFSQKKVNYSQNTSQKIAQMQQNSLILQKALILQTVHQIWSQVLPENLRPYCIVGGFNDGILTVFVSQNAIAAKIKLISASLLIQLKNQLEIPTENRTLEVTAIRVKVQVISVNKPQKIKQNRHLSKQSAMQLKHLAQTMQGSDLAESLQRLASHSQNEH